MDAPLLFGPFLLQPTQRRLLRDNRVLPLGARAFDVLLTLARAQGGLVTKAELLDRVWPGLVVEEANVHVQLSALRKLLGTDAVATVPGLGYRLALPLRQPDLPCQLPTERSSFIGRPTLLAQVRSHLVDGRLLTLVGLGGSGKTRLAQRLAHEQAAEGQRRVAWMDLTTLRSADALLPALADALGCRPAAGQLPEQALQQHLAGRPWLAVLDNCEDLLEPVAALAERLLTALPCLTLLCTSREPLGLPGEAVLAIGPMDLPPADADEAALARNEAMQLLQARARQAGAPLPAAPANWVSLVALARHLDGMPLALELAAAQLPLLGPAQLLSLLQAGTVALGGGTRAPTRHRSLQAVIRWSWTRLDGQARALLTALAACPGGCTLETAAALLPPAADFATVHTGLQRLADLSLLIADTDTDPRRYRILQTVRQFVEAEARAAGSWHEVQHRLRHHLGHLVAEAERHRTSPQHPAWLTRLDAEQANLMALAVSDQPADDTSLDTAAALGHYWIARGRLAVGLQWLDGQLQATPPGAPTPAQERAWRVSAQLALLMGRLDDAASRIQRSLALGRRLALPAETAAALSLAGRIDIDRKRPDTGTAWLHEALALARQHSLHRVGCDALNALGLAAMAGDDLAAARTFFERALQANAERGAHFGVLTEQLNLVQLDVRQGEPNATQALLAVWQGLQHTPHAYLQREVAEVAQELALGLHEPARAVRWGAALSREQPRGCTQDEPASAAVQARARLHRREADEAARAGLALRLEALQTEVGAWLAERAADAPRADAPGRTAAAAIQPVGASG